MLLGYNTNGLANHALPDAIELLGAIGYQSVAITIDHHALNPKDDNWPKQLDLVSRLLQKHSMRSVIETGARYLLNPVHKHEPTMLSPVQEERAIRIDFLKHAIDVASAIGSDCVSLWSGALPDGTSEREAWWRLEDCLEQVLEHAAYRKVVIGFEPEPGMLIDTMEKFSLFRNHLAHPLLKLTLDVGHLHCMGEFPLAESIQRFGDSIVNVHIEDMQAGIHEHLPFGEGEIDFPPVFKAFSEVNYAGGLHVELSRHSHVGPQAAMNAFVFLRNFIETE